MQTFFAMPLFDFSTSSKTPSVRPSFWIYWVLTIPLTAIVLTIYLSYLVRSQRRDREEDQMAREAIVQKRDLRSLIVDGEKPFNESQTSTSFLTKLVSQGFHSQPAQDPSLSPELGLQSSEDRVLDLKKRKRGKQPYYNNPGKGIRPGTRTSTSIFMSGCSSTRTQRGSQSSGQIFHLDTNQELSFDSGSSSSF